MEGLWDHVTRSAGMALFGTMSNAMRSFRAGFKHSSPFGVSSELGKRRREDNSNSRNVSSRSEPYRYGGRRSASSMPPRYRGTFRRSGYYGRYTRGSAVARLRRGLDIEKKFFDTAISFNYDSTGEVPATGQLNLIPQGVTESTRVGRKCTVNSIQCRLNCIFTPGANTTGCTTQYLILVLDTQCNGAAAAVTDVFTSTTLSTAMINLANSERFKILKRWTFKLQAGAGVQTAFGQDQFQLEYYKKCRVPLEFSSTTGAITELKSNNLFFIAGTDTETDDLVQCAGTVRLRFTDI